MEATIVIIENEADLAAAQALVAELSRSTDPTDIGRLRAQALILQAYEANHLQTAQATPAEIISYLTDQSSV